MSRGAVLKPLLLPLPSLNCSVTALASPLTILHSRLISGTSTKRFFRLLAFTFGCRECPRLVRGMVTFSATYATIAAIRLGFARGGFAAAGETKGWHAGRFL